MTRPITLRLSHALADPSIVIDDDRFVLRNVSVIQRGPALGHGFEVDDVMLSQVASAINTAKGGRGVKSRLTHPGLTEFGGRDGIEVTLGRVRNARVDGDRVRGDAHLARFASLSPQGDLRAYLLAIAREDPELVGLSIVFDPDQPVEEIVDEARPESRETEDGHHVVKFGRVKRVLAADFVGDPAANAEGLVARLPAVVRYGLTPGLIRQWLAGVMEPSLDQTQAVDTGDQSIEPTNPSPRPVDGGFSGSGTPLQERDTMTLEKNPTHSLAPTAAALASTTDPDPKPAGTAVNPGTDPGANPGANPGGDSLAGHASNGGGAAATATAPSPQALAALKNEGVQEALKLERERVTEIRAMATTLGLGDAWPLEMIGSNKSVDEAKDHALKVLAKRREPIAGLGGPPSIAGGHDRNRESLADAIGDAIFIKYGKQDELYESDRWGKTRRDSLGNPVRRDPHERAHEFRGMTLCEMSRHFLNHVGVNSYGMDRPALARAVFNRSIAMSHSTSDFPKILADSIAKRVRASYELRPATWPRWAARSTAPDFKTISRPGLGSVPAPPQVGEHGEYTYAKIGEEGETYALAKYGQLFNLSWEAIVNDDLGVFTRANIIGNALTSLEDDLAYLQITANGVMADTIALFHADHGNLAAGGGNVGAPTVDLMGKARAAMALQKGIGPDDNTDGPPLNLEARVILVPWELEVSTAQLITSQVDPTKSNATPNPQFIQNLILVADGRLSASSTTAWYLVADPNQAASVEVCFLAGNEAPFIEEQDDFKTDGRTWKMRHVAAAKALDYRGLYKNPGA